MYTFAFKAFVSQGIIESAHITHTLSYSNFHSFFAAAQLAVEQAKRDALAAAEQARCVLLLACMSFWGFYRASVDENSTSRCVVWPHPLFVSQHMCVFLC